MTWKRLILALAVVVPAVCQLPNYWRRADGVLSPRNANDVVEFGTTLRLSGECRASAPDAPASGYVHLYCDSGDGNRVKAIRSDGTIVTLGADDLGAATAEDVGLLFPEGGDYLKRDGTTGTPAAGGLVDWQKAIAEITLDTTDKTIYTTTLASGIPEGKCIALHAAWDHTAGTAGVTYRIYLGANSYVIAANSNVTSNNWNWSAEICNDAGSQTAQTVLPGFGYSGSATLGGTGAVPAALATDVSGSVVLKLTANGAGTEGITGLGWLVRSIQ